MASSIRSCEKQTRYTLSTGSSGKDLFLRGVRHLSPGELREQTLATRLVLQRLVEGIPMSVNGPQGEATLQESIFRPILHELAARNYAPKSFGELLRAIPAFSLPELVTAGAVLVGAGHAAPCQAELAAPGTRKTCEALNNYLLERARTRDEIGYLASPVIGGGIAVDRFQQLFLLARNAGADQPTEWASVRVATTPGPRSKAGEGRQDNGVSRGEPRGTHRTGKLVR